MQQNDFEGTLVLEKLARIDALDEFMAAVDSEDTDKAIELMRAAHVDDNTISIVLTKMRDPYDDH